MNMLVIISIYPKTINSISILSLSSSFIYDVGINIIIKNEIKIEIKEEDFINLLVLQLAKLYKIPTKNTYMKIEYIFRIGIIRDKLNPE